jgi:hypothetical protein
VAELECSKLLVGLEKLGLMAGLPVTLKTTVNHSNDSLRLNPGESELRGEHREDILPFCGHRPGKRPEDLV